MTFWESLTARARTALTLGVLGLVFVAGVVWAFGAATEPLPERADPPICISTRFQEGDLLRPGNVTVSVINAGDRAGLASLTRQDLVERGFDRGQLDNAPAGTQVRSVEIWTKDPENPAVKLVRSYLGGRVNVVDQDPVSAGVNVVVGNRFPGVRKGAAEVAVTSSASVCSPPDAGLTP
ncbi:LytR C-terminal domain-containing protein [Nocardioides sp. R-C-SC26]|uniref:LytR C-terminal domain-containing protein n=1 Tax=Nocardioides sp. R-C-SC26 TaxID=2870414 RepID=UPI001E49F56F|nr:LytR C-terminal domain-containing protein [Nocardioides sp. R-C-SC26]